MTDKVTIKKIKRRRDDGFEKRSSSAYALRTASSYLKHKKAAAVQWLRASWWLTSKGQELCDGFSKLLCTNSSYQRKKFWMWIRYDCCVVVSCRLPLRVLLLFLVHLAGLRLLASCFCVGVAPNPRILWYRIWEFSTATACVVSHVFFLVLWVHLKTWCIAHCPWQSVHAYFANGQASSAQQILFSCGYDPYTLACKARPSFDRCGTFLSVSLSLSNSRNVVPSSVKSWSHRLFVELPRWLWSSSMPNIQVEMVPRKQRSLERAWCIDHRFYAVSGRDRFRPSFSRTRSSQGRYRATGEFPLVDKLSPSFIVSSPCSQLIWFLGIRRICSSFTFRPRCWKRLCHSQHTVREIADTCLVFFTQLSVNVAVCLGAPFIILVIRDAAL